MAASTGRGGRRGEEGSLHALREMEHDVGENMGSWVRTWDPWVDLGLDLSSVTYQRSGDESVNSP